MKLLTAELREQLLTNGRGQNGDIDYRPVVKFFTPDANCTWIFTELNEDGDTLFGLCDVGMGSPELGYASLAEIEALRGKLGLPVERDIHIKLDSPLSWYAEQARKHGRILV